MKSPIYLNLLWLIPVITWFVTRNKPQIVKSTIRGVSFGLIVSSASMGLYSFYFIGPLSAIFGMLGLVLTMFHQPAGYNLAIIFNLIPSHTVITGSDRPPIEIINTIFWAFCYGTPGLIWGYYKNKRKITSANKSS